MKRWLILWGLLSFACGMWASPFADSVRSWLESGDRSAWLEATSEMQRKDLAPNWGAAAGVPPVLQVAALPVEKRPEWARVPDTTLWNWFRLSHELIFFKEELRLVEGEPTVLSPEERLVAFRKSEVLPWQIANVMFWAFTLIGGLGLWWIRSKSPPKAPRSERWGDLQTAFLRGEWSDETRLRWGHFKSQTKNTVSVVDLACFAHLSHSEKELIQYIMQDLSNEESSKLMACSPSYIYNLRSSIRTKLQLASDQNLDVEVRKLVRESRR